MAKLNNSISIVFMIWMYFTATVIACNGGLGKCTSDADCCAPFRCIVLPLDGATCRSHVNDQLCQFHSDCCGGACRFIPFRGGICKDK
ncbi:unnamed protein product [Cunninghamella blakesleeana]